MNGKVYQLNVEDFKDKDCTEETKRQWRKLDRVRHAFLMELKHGGNWADLSESFKFCVFWTMGNT
jgi:hypothetical protein